MDQQFLNDDSMETDEPHVSHDFLASRQSALREGSIHKRPLTLFFDHDTDHHDGLLQLGKSAENSFDASFEQDATSSRQTFESSRILRAAESWDTTEREGSSSMPSRDTTGATEHGLNQCTDEDLNSQFSIHMPELPPAKTLRTTPGRLHCPEPNAAPNNTPVRLRFRPPGASIHKRSNGKLTPVSARRHKMSLLHHQRPSPSRRAPQKMPRDSLTPSTYPNPPPFTTAVKQTSHLNSTEHYSDTDTDNTPFSNSAKNKRAAKVSLGSHTVAAVAGCLETTTETIESGDTENSNTPFRFASFPASLPRISHCPRTRERTHQNAQSACPTTVRKRMSFREVSGPTHGSRENLDDNGTHNSSMSSFLDEGQLYFDDHRESTFDDETDKSNHTINCASPLGTPIPRARLNFSSVLCSPSMNLQQQFSSDQEDQGRGDCGDDLGRGTSTTSPGRNSSAFPVPRPTTPREVQLHFQLDAAQCSPIPGIPEEDGDSSSRSAAASGHNTSRLSKSSCSSSTARERATGRPMPDMAAFDGDLSSTSKSVDDSKSSCASKPNPPSPKLLCPPTPVRTPAWAHNDHPRTASAKPLSLYRMGRSNSLIATKVLATCSSSALEERASVADHDTVGSDVDGMVVDSDIKRDAGADWLHDARSVSQAPGRDPEQEQNRVVSMASHFEVLSTLGRGAFADVYRVKSKVDGCLYAVKRNRRQFRGTRDRDKALSEVRSMQRLQCPQSDQGSGKGCSSYLLFFFQAWQEDGHFFCQTELCCRDTCRELMDSLRSQWNFARAAYPSLSKLPPPTDDNGELLPDAEGRLFPEPTIWKICHDVCAGLSFIHSRGLVHFDIKPSNLFFVTDNQLGAVCKIGDFGIAGEVGSPVDGQEGDPKYMPSEVLSSDSKHPSADIFSFGLTLYEMASSLSSELPSEGTRWHELRNGRDANDIPRCRSTDLVRLILSMIHPERAQRPVADSILALEKVASAGISKDEFLRDYFYDIEAYDVRQEQNNDAGRNENETPRHSHPVRACSPSAANFPKPPLVA